MRPRSLLVRYAAGLVFAYLLSAAEVVAIVVSVSGETVIGAQAVLSVKNLIATVAVVVVGTVTVAWAASRWSRALSDRVGIEKRPAAQDAEYHQAPVRDPADAVGRSQPS